MTEAFEPKYDQHGLLTAVVQDAENGEVLMVAFMNAEALDLTIKTGTAHYFSRSRQKIWLKGEQSGHVQRVKEMRIDCDQDAVLLKVHQEKAACHRGYRSCFYRAVEGGRLHIADRRLVDPNEVYRT